MSRKKRRADPSMNNPVLIGSVGRQLVTRNGAAPYLHKLMTLAIKLNLFFCMSSPKICRVSAMNVAFRILLLNWIHVILMSVCSAKRGGWNFKIALSPQQGAACFLQAGMNGKELV